MSEELKAIRDRHETDKLQLRYGNRELQELYEAAHADRATLLSLLTAYQARAEAAEAALKRVRDLLEMAESDDHNGYISIADNRRKDALKAVYAAMRPAPEAEG